MLSSISWTQFFLFMGGATLVWVLYVLRHHILGRHPKQPDGESESGPAARRIWSVQQHAPTSADPASNYHPNHQTVSTPIPEANYIETGKDTRSMPTDEDQHYSDDDDTTSTDYAALESLAFEISDITASLGITTTEEVLLQSLKKKIDQYLTLDKPVHRTAINQLIMRCALQDCGITLAEEKITGLWER